MNPFREINWQPGLDTRREFARSLMMGFPAVALVLLVSGWLRGAGWSVRIPLAVGGVGLGTGLLLWLAPQIARPFYVAWHLVAALLNFLIGNIVLAAVYLFLVTPIGIGRRVMGRSPLTKGFDRRRASYWDDVERRERPERHFRQF